MEPDDRPDRPLVTDSEINYLYALAKKTGIYRAALVKQGISAELADQLTRDWHANQVGWSERWSASYLLIRDNLARK